MTQFADVSIEEIEIDVYRISIPVPPEIIPGGFSFNQYLIVDELPMLYHTGPRKAFGLVRDAINKVIPVNRLAFIGFSHVESDECGALNDFLQAAPASVPVCSAIAAMVSIEDLAIRAPKAMLDDEVLDIGQRKIRWIDTPHVPHGWECGMVFEETARTLFCGDLFTQPGHETPAITREDILSTSETFRASMDYYSHSKGTYKVLSRLAALQPEVLACMHGSAWRGNGERLLLQLARTLERGHSHQLDLSSTYSA